MGEKNLSKYIPEEQGSKCPKIIVRAYTKQLI